MKPNLQIEIVERQSHEMDGLGLLDISGAVWLTFSRPWWDLSAWFWWWLTNGPKKWIFLRSPGGNRIRIQAVCLSTRHVRLGRPANRRGTEMPTGELHDTEKK